MAFSLDGLWFAAAGVTMETSVADISELAHILAMCEAEVALVPYGAPSLPTRQQRNKQFCRQIHGHGRFELLSNDPSTDVVWDVTCYFIYLHIATINQTRNLRRSQAAEGSTIPSGCVYYCMSCNSMQWNVI